MECDRDGEEEGEGTAKKKRGKDATDQKGRKRGNKFCSAKVVLTFASPFPSLFPSSLSPFHPVLIHMNEA